MPQTRMITPQELAAQQPYKEQVRKHYAERGCAPLACVRTYGCQQNVADSERIRGMLAEMGFGFTDSPEEADVILFNTCAVREHAQDRVFGNVGALKSLKRRKPSLIIGLCGCMVQQETVVQRLREHFPFVNLVFGTHVLHRLPELLSQALHKRVYETPSCDGVIAEDLPIHRDGEIKAWLPIMYGCNNFCTYCIVPYVRGRERSRRPEKVLEDAKQLAAQGYREITLLGQNVNSYGRDADFDMDFPTLLERVNEIDGDFLIRFMTSHPKDATPRLFETIARCQKVSRHFHLPFQSGSNRILKAMNRGYTREHYMSLIQEARRIVPDIVFTSDVIVGFPGETREDFEQTMSLIEEVGFDSLFTFIYSPRHGTPAASMPDPISAEEKSAWFMEMTALQEKISAERLKKMIGTRQRVMIEQDLGGFWEARLADNRIVRVQGQNFTPGQQVTAEITDAGHFYLTGEVIKE